MRAARGLTGSLFVSNKPADLKKAINPLKKRRPLPGPRLIRLTLVPIRAGRDLIVQAKVSGFRPSFQTRLYHLHPCRRACAGMTRGAAARNGRRAFSRPSSFRPACMDARLQGCRAFGELSGSAELTEDRAVVERRLPAAGRSGTGRRGGSNSPPLEGCPPGRGGRAAPE